MYQHLSQYEVGRVARCFGTAEIYEKRSIVLEWITGKTLLEVSKTPSGARIADFEIENQLQLSARELNKAGVVHGDPKLDQYIMNEHGVWIVGFEHAWIMNGEMCDRTNQADIGNLMEEFRASEPRLG